MNADRRGGGGYKASQKSQTEREREGRIDSNMLEMIGLPLSAVVQMKAAAAVPLGDEPRRQGGGRGAKKRGNEVRLVREE